MSTATGIEWTEKTWNPLAGCTPVSAGCLNCYAATMANRLHGMTLAGRKVPGYEGAPLTALRSGRRVFTGEVRLLEQKLTEPLSWRKPAMVFVNSMSDLFHESVPFEFIDKVFAVMALTPHLTYQVLTKRPERMAEYFSEKKWHPDVPYPYSRNARVEGESQSIYHKRTVDNPSMWLDVYWPLPNVWLGTSVEDQAAADARIPHLLRCPAAVRFLSCEPLIGEVDLSDWVFCDNCRDTYPWGAGAIDDPLSNAAGGKPWMECRCSGINWVIVGGESGARSRPCDVAWVRSIVRQCRDAGVPCFVKQDSGSRSGMQGRLPDNIWNVKEFPNAKS